MGGADKRPEELINYYAKARVGVRKIANAAGFFALLWSTVVLLGGFVSVLRIKDFLFLSVLSLLMASKMVEIWDARTGGIYVAERHILRLTRGQDQLRGDNRILWWTRLVILSTAIPVKIILTFGVWAIVSNSPYVGLVLSAVRLIQQDYGDVGGDAENKEKLNAALIIFYFLVIFQSISFFYYAFLTTHEPWMLVSKQLAFGIWGPKIVSRYRTETKAKCYKDGVLPKNWSLITFSVGLLESASLEDHRLWGARVLDTFIGKGIPIKEELLSSSLAIQNLIDMIGLTTRDNPEIRERATRIIADLASELHISQFPDVLRCICCLLLESSPEVAFQHGNQQQDAHYLSLPITEQADHKKRSRIQFLRMRIVRTRKEMHDWERYFGDKYHYSYVSKGTKELISQGLVILEGLTQDKDNCIEIIKHQRLVSKITLPLSYQDLLSHGWEDHTWAEMLSRSLTVVSRLIRAGPTDETTRLQHDMSRNTVAVRNLMCILEVGSEGAFSELRGLAIEILAELAFVDSFGELAFDESTSMTEMLIKTLQRILLEDRDGNAIVAKEDEQKDKRVRRKAGKALARLLLRVPSASDNSVALASAPNVNDIDLVLPKQDMVNLLTKETEEQSQDRKMLVSMLSLTMAICNKNVISGDDFTRAIPDDAALVKKLKEIVEMLQDATTGGWRILKLVCQVVIAVVQLKPSCTREFNEHKFKEALSKALATMSAVDNCMIFAGNDREVPVRSLASLVKEAQELLAQEQGDIIST